jgi:hypothetical protein
MNHLFEILTHWAGHLLDPVGTVLALLSNGGAVLSLASALVMEYGKIQESYLSNARRWHGRISEKFVNVDHLVRRVEEHQKEWQMPADLFDTLVNHRDRLLVLVPHCQGSDGGPKDRAERDTLLRTSVFLCRNQVKEWAYGKLADGTMTVDDIHSLFLLAPGDIGGRRKRAQPTDEQAKIGVQVIGPDFIRVGLTHAAGKNAAGVTHGWPTGVRHALIVIRSVVENVEVIRRITTRLRTTIKMPEGSHGKQFFVEAAFLKHVDDFPRFGAQHTFTLPFMTEDVVDTINRKQVENQVSNEMEEMRRKIERLTAELEAVRKK